MGRDDGLNEVDYYDSGGGGGEGGRRCPIAFVDIGGRCYFFGYFKLNWFRAMEFCHSFGQSVSLACIETEQENQSLKRWLLLNGKSVALLLLLWRDTDPNFAKANDLYVAKWMHILDAGRIFS